MMSLVFLGEAYTRGFGVQKNYAEAERWYRRAAATGEPLGEHQLGSLYLKMGRTAEAIELFEKAASKKYASSLYVLGRIYLLGGADVPRQPERAEELLKQGHKLGNLYATGALSEYWRSGQKGPWAILPGIWLGAYATIQFFIVLLTEGWNSERLRF
jgi:TPR repeat protein